MRNIWKPSTHLFLLALNILLFLYDQKPSGGTVAETAGTPDAHVLLVFLGTRPPFQAAVAVGLSSGRQNVSRSDACHVWASHSRSSFLFFLTYQQKGEDSMA